MIIALNNKCHFNKEEFINYLEELSTINTTNKVILCPTFLNIPLFNNESIDLGAQDVSCTNNGSYTGEISARDLKSFDVKYTIVGHSERRKNQKETNEEITLKVKELLSNDITPILCVGETKEEKGYAKEVIRKQLENILNIENKNRIIIAYEPVWSIGTGILPENNEIEEMITYIKELLPNNYVLYGGSVSDENIDNLNSISSIDGYLIGGLSLKVDKLKNLINKCN